MFIEYLEAFKNEAHFWHFHDSKSVIRIRMTDADPDPDAPPPLEFLRFILLN